MPSAKWRLFCLGLDVLTFCGQVSPYGDIYLVQNKLRFCSMAPIQYQNQCWLLIDEVLWHFSPRLPKLLSWKMNNHTFEITAITPCGQWVNTLRPRKDSCHLPDEIFKCVLWNENVSICINISQTFVPRSQINNIPALVQIMACRQPVDKPLSESMVILLTHICVTRPQ